jgi:hypothetical protein
MLPRWCSSMRSTPLLANVQMYAKPLRLYRSRLPFFVPTLSTYVSVYSTRRRVKWRTELWPLCLL